MEEEIKAENKQRKKMNIISMGIILMTGIGALVCFGFILLDAFLFGEKIGIQAIITLSSCMAIILILLAGILFPLSFLKRERYKKSRRMKMGTTLVVVAANYAEVFIKGFGEMGFRVVPKGINRDGDRYVEINTEEFDEESIEFLIELKVLKENQQRENFGI